MTPSCSEIVFFYIYLTHLDMYTSLCPLVVPNRGATIVYNIVLLSTILFSQHNNLLKYVRAESELPWQCGDSHLSLTDPGLTFLGATAREDIFLLEPSLWASSEHLLAMERKEMLANIGFFWYRRFLLMCLWPFLNKLFITFVITERILKP